MALEGKQFSHYRILKLIGKGGMGEVYLTEDTNVQRKVATKVIKIESHLDEEALTQALRTIWREASTIAGLDDSSILPLYESDETTIDGLRFAYLIMPYRPEGSLATWLKEQAKVQKTQRLMLKQVVHLIKQAGKALQYAHSKGIMHLDIKPDNFLVRSKAGEEDYPELLLSDFGIARLEYATLSMDSMGVRVRGTPYYMAPEQSEGKPVLASDQYALAVMAYQLLTGKLPFTGTYMEVMRAHATQQPGSVCQINPQLPPTVDRVLQRALKKKPEDRFSTVSAFARGFQVALEDVENTTALGVLRPSSPPQTLPPTWDMDGRFVISEPAFPPLHMDTTRWEKLKEMRSLIVLLSPLIIGGLFWLYRFLFPH